jgi:hypothetical protein
MTNMSAWGGGVDIGMSAYQLEAALPWADTYPVL